MRSNKQKQFIPTLIWVTFPLHLSVCSTGFSPSQNAHSLKAKCSTSKPFDFGVGAAENGQISIQETWDTPKMIFWKMRKSHILKLPVLPKKSTDAKIASCSVFVLIKNQLVCWYGFDCGPKVSIWNVSVKCLKVMLVSSQCQGSPWGLFWVPK